MKTAFLLFSALFGVWFWQRPATSRSTADWPVGMPVFAGGHAHCAHTLKNGTAFACLLVNDTPQAALACARQAYAADGWQESPVCAHDTLIFTRGEAVAVLLAEDTPTGARVTAIQRPKGL